MVLGGCGNKEPEPAVGNEERIERAKEDSDEMELYNEIIAFTGE